MANTWTQDTPVASAPPASMNDEWIANWDVIAKALAVSGSSATGGHLFPGGYATTAGQHVLGQVSVTLMGSTAGISASDNVQYGLAYDIQTREFKYNDGAEWQVVNDFITQDIGPTISENISFGGSGDSSKFVDGRDYYHDGNKLDDITKHARLIVHAYGTVAHGSNIPWPTDAYSIATSGSNLTRNGDFTLGASAWIASNSVMVSTVDAQSGSQALVINASACSGGATQIVAVTSSTSSSSMRLSFYYKSANDASAQFAVYDETNSQYLASYTPLMSAATYTLRNHDFAIPETCLSVEVRLTDAASTSTASVWYDEVELIKTGWPTITPASCENMSWTASVNHLYSGVGTWRIRNEWEAWLNADGDGVHREANCRIRYLHGGTGNWTWVTGTMNYIIIGVRSI